MKILKLLCLFLSWSFLGCAQAPENRPTIENPAFDKKLTRLLSFDVPLIGVEELAERQTEFVILDAREKEEYDISHIKNARFIGYKKFDKKTVAAIPKDKPIAIYCSVGYRSEKIGEQLKEAGFTNVYNLYGSIFEWVNQGHPVINNSNAITDEVHTYNTKWGQWVTNPKVKKITN